MKQKTNSIVSNALFLKIRLHDFHFSFRNMGYYDSGLMYGRPKLLRKYSASLQENISGSSNRFALSDSPCFSENTKVEVKP